MTPLNIGLAIVLSLFVIAVFWVKRTSDPHSVAVICFPMIVVPVLFFSMWGARGVISAFREMATTGLGGVRGIVSALEPVNRVYTGVHAASAIALGVLTVIAVIALTRSAAAKESSRLRIAIGVGAAVIAAVGALAASFLDTRSIVYPLAVVTMDTERDPVQLTMTLEAAESLQVENTDMASVSNRIAQNLFLQTLVAFVLIPLSVAGSVTNIALGTGSAVPRFVGVVGLALALFTAVTFGVQTYRHVALAGELSYVLGNDGTQPREN